MTQNSAPNTFTPKQVALALGVSESSVKRWCDSGRVQAERTAGGHRKMTLAAVLELVRETGHPVIHPAALGMVAVSARHKPCEVRGQLHEALLDGDEAACRELILGLYQQGASIVAIGDELIGPVFQQIGEGWQRGDVTIHQERASCAIVVAAMHELRRMLPPPAADAPLALTATPLQDFAEVPIGLVELVLRACGWRIVSAGCALPVEEIARAIVQHRPDVVCLSVTHLADAETYITQHNELLFQSAEFPPFNCRRQRV